MNILQILTLPNGPAGAAAPVSPEGAGADFAAMLAQLPQADSEGDIRLPGLIAATGGKAAAATGKILPGELAEPAEDGALPLSDTDLALDANPATILPAEFLPVALLHPDAPGRVALAMPVENTPSSALPGLAQDTAPLPGQAAYVLAPAAASAGDNGTASALFTPNPGVPSTTEIALSQPTRQSAQDGSPARTSPSATGDIQIRPQTANAPAQAAMAQVALPTEVPPVAAVPAQAQVQLQVQPSALAMAQAASPAAADVQPIAAPLKASAASVPTEALPATTRSRPATAALVQARSLDNGASAPAPLFVEVSAPGASEAAPAYTAATPVDAPDLAATVDRLVENRIASRETRSEVDVPHPDFGRVTLSLSLDAGDVLAVDLPDAPAELRTAVTAAFAAPQKAERADSQPAPAIDLAANASSAAADDRRNGEAQRGNAQDNARAFAERQSARSDNHPTQAGPASGPRSASGRGVLA